MASTDLSSNHIAPRPAGFLLALSRITHQWEYPTLDILSVNKPPAFSMITDSIQGQRVSYRFLIRQLLVICGNLSSASLTNELRVTIVSVAAPLALSLKILFAYSQIPEMSKHGHDNPSFVGDFVYTIPGEFRQNFTQFYPGKHRETFDKKRPPPSQFQVPSDEEKPASNEKAPKVKDRDSWGKGIEFLLSCIAMSVGLGNIWRFPFIALGESGRGVK